MALAGDHVMVKMDDSGGTLRTFASGDLISVDVPVATDQFDVTGFGDVGHKVINGQQRTAVTLRGYLTTTALVGTHPVVQGAFQAGTQVTLKTIDVSPDGEFLTFVEDDTLWRVPMHGTSDPIPLLDDISGYMSSVAWSPDGNHIAFALQGANGYDSIGLLSSLPNQTSSIQIVIGRDDYIVEVRWSPNGEWLLPYIRLRSSDSNDFSWYRVRPNGDEFSELPQCPM